MSRLLAVVTVLVTRAVTPGGLPQTGTAPNAVGWWMWDAGWYRLIADHGYPQSHTNLVRFFPVLPVLGRAVGWVLRSNAAGLLAVAWAAALAYAVLLALLARRELDRRGGRQVPWFALVAPGGIALALAYAEPLEAALVVGYLLALRHGRGRAVWWVVPLGLLAGAARPTGIVLAAPAFLELLARRSDHAMRPALAAAVVAPLAGAGGYCMWAWAAFGEFALPFRAQTGSNLRGSVVADPVRTILLSTAHAYPVWADVLLALVVLALCIAAFRVLPRSLAVWTALMAFAAVTSTRPLSLARYFTADVGLPLTVAALVRRRRTAVLVGIVGAVTFLAVAVSAMRGDTIL